MTRREQRLRRDAKVARLENLLLKVELALLKLRQQQEREALLRQALIYLVITRMR